MSGVLKKGLLEKTILNPFQILANPKNPPRKNYDIAKYLYNQAGEPIYAVVDMDIVIGRPNRPSTMKPLTYHGNDKWSMTRKNKDRLLKSYQSRSGMGKKLKPAKRALVSYEEMTDKVNDGLDLQGKKHSPGVSLIRLHDNHLESAGKFPVVGKSSLVYGNLKNLGITYGNTNQRLEYSGFRKANNLLDLFDDTARPKLNSGPKKWIVLEIIPSKMRNLTPRTKKEVENNASEILDESSNSDEDYRRKTNSKFRKRDKYTSDWKSSKESDSSTSESVESSGSSNEKNDGNPFTLHKGKYKQNWMWNHYMDGDHMNINPYGPLFQEMTATGQDLFFGRKWWYFNQDDYKPMG